MIIDQKEQWINQLLEKMLTSPDKDEREAARLLFVALLIERNRIIKIRMLANRLLADYQLASPLILFD